MVYNETTLTMDSRGKFIVIEGTDGSGKTVQFERLVLALPENVKLGTLDFPRYSEPSSYFVQHYLTGKYGSDVGPRAASIFFAVDRFDAKLKIAQWFDEERVIVANRYVGSNMAHQGAKMENKKDRAEFFKWLYDLEYGIFGIPKPDLNIILHVPAEISYELIAKKAGREYLAGKTRDIHEADFNYQKRSEQVYLEIAELFPESFTIVECAPDGKLLSIDAIHEMVWAAARKTLGL
jgi:dTMP kinase